MKFSELQFIPHPNVNGMRAFVEFPNKYGASVVTGSIFYTDADHPYELAVMYDGSLCYTTPLTDDVIGHIDEAEVERLLGEIEKLPERID